MLKPDNVFIVERGTNPEFVKVLDFGVAKLRGDPSQPTNDKLTSTGMIIGTAPYMASEQWQGRPDIDGRADIYSLGVMLFEMLCGRRPYTAGNAYEWIVLHMEATPPDLQPFGVSPQLSRVVRRMLARQPELRQQSMREVLQDLRTASRGVRGIAVFHGEAATASAGAATAVSSPPPLAEPGLQTGTGYSAPTVSQAAPPMPQQNSYQQNSYQQNNYQQNGYQQNNYQQNGHQQNSYQQNGYQQGAGQVGMVQVSQSQSQVPTAFVPPSPWGMRLRRLGEFGLMLLIGVGYLAWNWRETMGWIRSALDTFRAHF